MLSEEEVSEPEARSQYLKKPEDCTLKPGAVKQRKSEGKSPTLIVVEKLG
jgi:hypothetical protein